MARLSNETISSWIDYLSPVETDTEGELLAAFLELDAVIEMDARIKRDSDYIRESTVGSEAVEVGMILGDSK